MFELSHKQKFGGSVRLYFGVDYLEPNINQVEVGDEMELTQQTHSLTVDQCYEVGSVILILTFFR